MTTKYEEDADEINVVEGVIYHFLISLSYIPRGFSSH